MASQTAQDCPTSTPCRPTLILGLGNILLRDEGVGVRVVETMQHMPLPAGVELCDGGTAGLDLLDVIADRPKVIVIDAVDARHEPGTVVRLTPDDLLASRPPSISLHEIGFFETLTAARLLGIAPREVVIIGVQPLRLDCGLDLSPPIAARIPGIISAVLAELEPTSASAPAHAEEREDRL